MDGFMVFLEIDGKMRKIFHMARGVGEGFADVPNEDVGGHTKAAESYSSLVMDGKNPRTPPQRGEIDADPVVWAWSHFPKLFPFCIQRGQNVRM